MPRGSAENEFSAEVKSRLAARAGFRCSAPWCRAHTSGPSETRRSGISNVGQAAHISGAREGAARWDPSLTPAQRSAYENGVWLCSTHAKAIDDDETRFTVGLLTRWRETAERIAGDEQGVQLTAARPEYRALVEYRIDVPRDTAALRIAVADYLHDVGVSRAWAPQAEAVRMLLFEIALNATTHGAAERLELETSGGVVSLRDDGAQFGIAELRSPGRGGNRALTDFEADAAGSLSLRYRRVSAVNEWSIVDEVLASQASIPCSLVIDEPRDARPDFLARALDQLEDCAEIHVYPGKLWSYSDWFTLLARLAESSGGTLVDAIGDRTIVVHGVGNDSPISQLLEEHFPRLRLPD